MEDRPIQFRLLDLLTVTSFVAVTCSVSAALRELTSRFDVVSAVAFALAFIFKADKLWNQPVSGLAFSFGAAPSLESWWCCSRFCLNGLGYRITLRALHGMPSNSVPFAKIFRTN
jgi:hypothetical protein